MKGKPIKQKNMQENIFVTKEREREEKIFLKTPKAQTVTTCNENYMVCLTAGKLGIPILYGTVLTNLITLQTDKENNPPQ